MLSLCRINHILNHLLLYNRKVSASPLAHDLHLIAAVVNQRLIEPCSARIYRQSTDRSSYSSLDRRVDPRQGFSERASFLRNELFEVLFPPYPSISMRKVLDRPANRLYQPALGFDGYSWCTLDRPKKPRAWRIVWQFSQLALLLLELLASAAISPVIYFRCIKTNASAFFLAISRRLASCRFTHNPRSRSALISLSFIFAEHSHCLALAMSLSTTLTPQP